MKDIFLPPGVQARLFKQFGTCPRQASVATAGRLEALWRSRNQAPEEQLDAIDGQMEQIAVGVALSQGHHLKDGR